MRAWPFGPVLECTVYALSYCYLRERFAKANGLEVKEPRNETAVVYFYRR